MLIECLRGFVSFGKQVIYYSVVAYSSEISALECLIFEKKSNHSFPTLQFLFEYLDQFSFKSKSFFFAFYLTIYQEKLFLVIIKRFQKLIDHRPRLIHNLKI